MRTDDFSRAPKQGQAEAVLVVEIAAGRRSEGGAPVSLAKVAAEVRGAPGHVWSKRFRRHGFSSGLVACFATPAEAEAAARVVAGSPRVVEGSPRVVASIPHLAAGSPRVVEGSPRVVADGGRVMVRVLEAEAGGYSNGVWRAEANVMAHIPAFTPTSVEAARGAAGPPVADPRAADHRSATRVGVSDRGARKKRDMKGERGAARERGARPVTDARAMFIGATKYRGPKALVQLSRTWYPMVARMQTLRGYVWHTIYWEPPFTLGTLAFFATRDDLLSFARLPAHRALMQWITRGTRNGTGGYIRLHLAPASSGPRGDQAGAP